VTAGKGFALTQRVKLSFHAQAFNVLNHAQWVGGRIDDVAPIGCTGSQRSILEPSSAIFNERSQVFSSNPRTLQLALKTGLLTFSPYTSGKEGFAGVSGFGRPFHFPSFSGCEQIQELASIVSAQAAGRVGGGGHGGGPTVSRRVCRDFGGSWIRQADARVEPKVILSARGAVAFARVFIAQAGQFVAAADAVAIAGFRGGFDGNESHEAPSRAR